MKGVHCQINSTIAGTDRGCRAPIGIALAQVARAYGATDIIVSDPDGSRRAQALTFGATTVLGPTVDLIGELGVDSFIDASGAPSAVNQGIRATRPAGTVILVGSGAESMELPTGRRVA